MDYYIPKSSSPRNFEKFPFNQICLRSTGCNATENEILTKFPKGVQKIYENVQEETGN